jgi:hypothetical protein
LRLSTRQLAAAVESDTLIGAKQAAALQNSFSEQKSGALGKQQLGLLPVHESCPAVKRSICRLGDPISSDDKKAEHRKGSGQSLDFFSGSFIF